MDSDQHTTGQMPRSDVSAGVGLAGLGGLLVWLMICRNWAVISPSLGLAGTGLLLDGSGAALIALLFSGIPMVLWSLCVDKVHRRVSTGIEWKNPRPLYAALETAMPKLAGLWATWLLIAALYCIGRWYWRGSYVFAMELMAMIIGPLVVASIVYVPWLDRYMTNPRDQAWHFGAMLIGRDAYDRQMVFHHLRGWAVKGFFIAFMFSILPGGWAAAVGAKLSQGMDNPIALTSFLINLMFMIAIPAAFPGA